MECLEKVVLNESRYFESESQFAELRGLIEFMPAETYTWAYSEDVHTCSVIAHNSKQKLVYCETGFGPSFPWGVLSRNDNDLGRDGIWHAYLYEAFVTSSLYSGKKPSNFEAMGPGERGET